VKVRVYQPPDGPARVVWPNWRTKRGDRVAITPDGDPVLVRGETDDEFLARVFATTEERDPTLQGLPFVDIEASQLPQERERRVGDEVHDVRSGWRVSGGRVVVDEGRVVRRRAPQVQP
jgi:hypothetical protein